MQNKANFQKSQMNVNTAITKDYENIANWTLGENKPNSNPIQTQYKANTNPIPERVKLMQSVYLQRIMKNNADRGYEKTKPKQTQSCLPSRPATCPAKL
jgi:beta-mannanase